MPKNQNETMVTVIRFLKHVLCATENGQFSPSKRYQSQRITINISFQPRFHTSGPQITAK